MATRRRIYLMRHGQVDYFDGRGEPTLPERRSLSAAGRTQARAAGKLLADAQVRPDRVIASDLPRTVETAQCVLDEMRCDVPVEQWPELREIKGGTLADIPEDRLEAEFGAALSGVADEHARFLRGETFGSLIDRVHGGIRRLLQDQRWDTLLMVLHGGVNRTILSYALTGTRMFLGNFQQAPGCINVLDVGSDWVVRAVNVYPADPAHTRTRATTMEELLEQYRRDRR
jgi:probable phosphoglycerate mutase